MKGRKLQWEEKLHVNKKRKLRGMRVNTKKNSFERIEGKNQQKNKTRS